MNRFEELEKKVQNVDPKEDQDQVQKVVQQIKDAREKGEIDEDEKTALIRGAKNKIAENIDLGGLDL